MRILLLASLLIVSCNSRNVSESTSPPKQTGLIADSAMVVTAHPAASQVGLDILQQDGNAVDAAIAVQLALAVVFPVAGNIGGGGFMVIRLSDGSINALDFREKAPALASRDMYLDEQGNVIEGLSLKGGLATGVPGTIDGMFAAHEKYGKLPMVQLITPSIKLARDGFAITKRQANNFNNVRDVLTEFNKDNSYLRKEGDWKENDTLVQEDLAQTLELIRDNGRDGFYKGPTAENLVTSVREAGGIISLQDLKDYKSAWREPVTGYYENLRIISMPPPSSGGIVLLQILEMIESQRISNDRPGYVQLLVEAERRAYADRATHIGDADFYPVPIRKMLDSNYNFDRIKDFDPVNATLSRDIRAGVFSNYEGEQTTHFSIVDTDGNAVAVTTTLNTGYGSKVFVTGSGFLLNNEMDDFSSKPGVPNTYGLVGAEANAIEPGKRMLSSMTPTIIEKNGRLFMVIGSPGGSTIITSVLQTLLNVAEFKMGMQQAVDAPRFHHQWLPDTIFCETETFDSATADALKRMGHTILERSPIGRVDAILVLEDGRLEGGADPRGDDVARGY